MVYQTILQKLNNKQPNSIELASCGIYDVAGKLIFVQDDLGDQATFTFQQPVMEMVIY
jgi:hypothetical protein